jgi:hypothetical protein
MVPPGVVHATGLHANKAVLHHVQATNAVRAAELSLTSNAAGDRCYRLLLLDCPAPKSISWVIRAFSGETELEHLLFRLIPGLQADPKADVEQIFVEL